MPLASLLFVVIIAPVVVAKFTIPGVVALLWVIAPRFSVSVAMVLLITPFPVRFVVVKLWVLPAVPE